MPALLAEGYVVREMLQAGVSVEDMASANVSMVELAVGGCGAAEILKLGGFDEQLADTKSAGGELAARVAFDSGAPPEVVFMLLAGVDEVPNGAFKGCSSLTGALTIPSSVTSIGKDAFRGTKITKITIPASTEYKGSSDDNTREIIRAP